MIESAMRPCSWYNNVESDLQAAAFISASTFSQLPRDVRQIILAYILSNFLSRFGIDHHGTFGGGCPMKFSNLSQLHERDEHGGLMYQ